MMTFPFILGDVEITRIEPSQKVFFMVIHLNALPSEMGSAVVQQHIARRILSTSKYLVDEDFIDAPYSRWTAMIAAVCH